ncbi:hypothetical protein GGR51DRAFT_514553 [Nemania sp. FL0031]|nr:hypothetical protein GGR51DRAFT_514553 [Nemania sp. FL0031]
MASEGGIYDGLIGVLLGDKVANCIQRLDELVDILSERLDRLEEKIAKMRAGIDNGLKSERSTPALDTEADPLQEPVDRNYNSSSSIIEKRLASLSLDPHGYKRPSRAQTKQEQVVLVAFPDAFCKSDADRLGICGVDNKVVIIPKNLRLVEADYTTLDKVRDIQILLARALVPYEYWPMRIRMELAGDFQQVARFIRNSEPEVIWMDFLEAVIQVLASYHVLTKPVDHLALLREERMQRTHNERRPSTQQLE